MATLIVANWKMSLSRQKSLELAEAMGEFSKSSKILTKDLAVALAPSALMLGEVGKGIAESGLGLAGQDCSELQEGSRTGDISAQVLKEYGCRYVIVGHSERRENQKETSEVVARKAEMAYQAGLTPIICIGESLQDREQGVAEQKLVQQLKESIPKLNYKMKRLIVAYEPIWSIGTGQVPTPSQIREVARLIGLTLNENFSFKRDNLQILYGGSVSPDNCEEITKIFGVNGLLVGGASLKYDQFVQIIERVSAQHINLIQMM